MSKGIRAWVAFLCAGVIALSFPATSFARSPGRDLCLPDDLFFGFFNGVQTTRRAAEDHLMSLKLLYGTEAPTGESIRYELLYNYTNGFEDFVETFAQRLQEQDGLLAQRFELFFDAVAGAGQGGWWRAITSAIPAVAHLLASLVDLGLAKAVRALTQLAGDPPTAANMAEHRLRIDNALLEGRKLLLFAHSQGNLFANAAYRHALANTDASAVRLVHVAPASAQVHGPHALADGDLVINALRLAGSVAPVTNAIPGYLDRPPGLNGQTDFLGHGLLEVYLNPSLPTAARVQAAVDAALAGLQAPPARAEPGFFTATLTWDGVGDVDLHVYEPSGTHVYYAWVYSDTGVLDVDNTQARGPEHYYVSCDPRRLQVGRYTVKLANFKGAKGRVATVQLASARGGVLGTRSVVLGEATSAVPAFLMFRVDVTRDPATGRYAAALAPSD